MDCYSCGLLLQVIAQHPYFMISRQRALALCMFTEELAENAFMVGRQYALYMVKNDCECCFMTLTVLQITMFSVHRCD